MIMNKRNKLKATNPIHALHHLGIRALNLLSANKIAAGALALLLTSGLAVLAEPGNDNRAPEVPPQIAVEAGNKVHFQAFGVGFQVYTWNGTNWGAPVPDAVLLHGEGVVATHFEGPTWESHSGSRVRGALDKPPVTVNTNAIPWLLLKAVSTEGPGIFADTTFIHRVNTTGGKAPTANGTTVGQIARVPYTADYVFYRKARQ